MFKYIFQSNSPQTSLNAGGSTVLLGAVLFPRPRKNARGLGQRKKQPSGENDHGTTACGSYGRRPHAINRASD
jgi:hypothetical protein